MAVTFKQLLNRALRVTGEDTIPDAATTVDDTYILKVAEVANQIKEEVEDAHNWRGLITRLSTGLTLETTPIGFTNARSRVLRVHEPQYDRLVPLVIDQTDSTAPYYLYELDLYELYRRRDMDTSSGNEPQYFAISQDPGDDQIQLELYPSPTDTRTVVTYLVVPQDRLDATDSTDLATNIYVPARPIELGLIRWILEDRGEELGINSQYSEEKYYTALQDAIAMDAAEMGEPQLVPV